MANAVLTGPRCARLGTREEAQTQPSRVHLRWRGEDGPAERKGQEGAETEEGSPQYGHLCDGPAETSFAVAYA